jgi:predicted pyridoxine 5'-phosphate oxidase superfamily flavin-nucleotide-binding protein
MSVIETTQQLRAVYLPAKERAVKKQMSRLDQHCKNFLTHVRFAVLSTCGQHGRFTARRRSRVYQGDG